MKLTPSSGVEEGVTGWKEFVLRPIRYLITRYYVNCVWMVAVPYEKCTCLVLFRHREKMMRSLGLWQMFKLFIGVRAVRGRWKKVIKFCPPLLFRPLSLSLICFSVSLFPLIV